MEYGVLMMMEKVSPQIIRCKGLFTYLHLFDRQPTNRQNSTVLAANTPRGEGESKLRRMSAKSGVSPVVPAGGNRCVYTMRQKFGHTWRTLMTVNDP